MFKPAFGLKNRHIQTIYASLFRKSPAIHFEIETFWLSDGDFVEAFWHKIKNHKRETPVVVIFHGLAGSYKSPYIKGVMHALEKSGFSSVLMHFRGCGDKDNLHARSYHSGDSQDALEFIREVKKRYPRAKLFGLGYSLGANMLLKLLGEEKESSLLCGAVAISPPMLLDVCAIQMNRGFSKFYQKLLLSDLNAALDKKYDTHDMKKLLNLERKDIEKLKTFWEFDGIYTAPIHGFESAQSYYTACSSRQFLKDINTTTLILHSYDDPFMTPAVIPNKEELSQSVELEITQNGGHVGFISGSIFYPEYWSEKRVVDFFHSLV